MYRPCVPRVAIVGDCDGTLCDDYDGRTYRAAGSAARGQVAKLFARVQRMRAI